MSAISTVCPHCGANTFVPGGSVDYRLRCTTCSGEFAFMSDTCERSFKTACPHCGSDLQLGSNLFDTPLRCVKCCGEFSVSDAQEEIRLYHTYAAVLWGIFTGLGPFLTGWFIKKNFEEMGMREEADEYGKFIKTYIIYSIIAGVAGVLIGLLLTPLLVAAAASGSGTAALFMQQLATFCSNVPLLLVGIYYWVFFIKYAIKSSRAEADCLSYHKYKSTWPAVLFLALVLNAVLLPALIIIAICI